MQGRASRPLNMSADNRRPFNPSMDKELNPLQSVRWNYVSIPKFNGATIEV